jgi:hypothetical protein
MSHAWKAGDRARVVDVKGLKGGRKPKGWTTGYVTRVRAVKASGTHLAFDEHLGWFETRRFEPA